MYIGNNQTYFGGIPISQSLAVSFKKVLTALLVCAVLLATASLGGSSADAVSSPGNFQVYLKLDAIPGESVAKGYEQWIPISDVHFGVEVPLSLTAIGSGSGSSKPQFDGLSFSKLFDSASMPIFLTSVQGKTIKNATLVFVKQAPTPVKFLTINLSNVFISNYSFDDTVESISLAYGIISIGYSSQKPDGTLNALVKSAWDVTKMAPATPVIP
ncbi:type VI secretion system tube protein Hcp [Paenibacillus sp. OV219]|uniref:Hcp family type VI secretion system effector n=1 Tax=Paenibacillus sp. OV219 TaxID=1884377 RepID=UPI0008B998A9|nr:type VI secretion system tube protein Hcp [Paenibacillus sp. OV219]SEO80870.1 Type VI protein secretion system component Hcp (secreted cytotoxin) [Paenibacillus sp. OV219]